MERFVSVMITVRFPISDAPTDRDRFTACTFVDAHGVSLSRLDRRQTKHTAPKVARLQIRWLETKQDDWWKADVVKNVLIALIDPLTHNCNYFFSQ
jgi:hypothetical protein